MPKVSVVIPVYRVEAYMERCAVSLFSQTLEDMEFIFVDDGSPDRSMDILREVLQRYPDRIPQTRLEAMPVHSGLAAVRKKGLLTASGDFVITCDSDDYVDPDMYGELYRSAILQEADLVQCDIEVRNGEFDDIDIEEALKMERTLDEEMYIACNRIDTSYQFRKR